MTFQAFQRGARLAGALARLRAGAGVTDTALDSGFESLAGSPAKTPAEAAVCARFRAHLERRVEEVNQGLARYESIKRFAILPQELSIDGGELTPTLKLKRRVIAEKYRETIEGLYA
jgi:long-subunit acyl-CoA synthetase (AMP-forming)